MIKASLPRLVGATAPLRERLHVPSALRYPHFRNYWLGLLASASGYQMLIMFSLGWLISHELTGDARYLGYMGTAIAVPAIVLTMFGGVFADSLNPKHLLRLTQSTTCAVVIGLAVLTALGVVNQWHVLVAAFLVGSIQAFDSPTRQSIFARLVDRKHLSNAVVLNSSVWTGTRIFAPFIAGVIIGRTNIATALFVSAAGFLAFSLISMSLRLSPVERATGSVLKEMTTGFLFIKRSPLFSILIGMTFFNSLFGMSYVFLMPVFADKVLEVGPEKIGLLMGAAGAGALTGILISINLSKVRYKGWILIGSSALFGIFLILFGVLSDAKQYELSMLMVFLGDMCASIYLMMVLTTLQARVPDQFRGRVMGFFTITWSLTPLGGLQASQIAYHIGAPVAVAIGGALVAAFALAVAVGNRQVRTLGATVETLPIS